MELNREQIVKALECCGNAVGCDSCPAEQPGYACIGNIMRQALALIKELTEENEQWRNDWERNQSQWEEAYEKLETDTVRKMKERLKECFQDTVDEKAIYTAKCIMFAIDQIAKEMLEDKDG